MTASRGGNTSAEKHLPGKFTDISHAFPLPPCCVRSVKRNAGMQQGMPVGQVTFLLWRLASQETMLAANVCPRWRIVPGGVRHC